MLRLFITLYLVILGAMFVFVVSQVKLPEAIAGLSNLDELEYQVTEGTFNLLDRSVAGMDADARREQLEHYRQKFGPLFDLLPAHEVPPLDDAQQKRLHEGLTVMLEREDLSSQVQAQATAPEAKAQQPKVEAPTMHYRKLPGADLVWQIHLDMDLTVNNLTTTLSLGKYSEGMMYLLQQRLQDHDSSQWRDDIKALQAGYAFPLSLEKISAQTLDADMLKALQAGEVVNLSHQERPVNLAQRIGNSEYLIKIGPVLLPWNIFYLGHLLLGLLALTFATATFLWIEREVYFLCVDDDGEGIAEEQRERLFEAFATIDASRNKESGGFGLGLAIVKRIVNEHGGEVKIQTSPLGGSRFRVAWPI